MSIYMWKFNTIPDPKVVECFTDAQVPLFSRNARYLTGGDGEPVVDLMKVEHNCGAVNLEFQLNGVEDQSGDLFCFPGYYPGDMDDEEIHSSTIVIPMDISMERLSGRFWIAPKKNLI